MVRLGLIAMDLQAFLQAPGDALLAEPPHRMHQEANGGALLLVGKHLDVSHPGSVIHSDVHLLVAGTRRAALPEISSDSMTHLLKTGQLFGVDMDHVPRLLPLVSLHRGLGIQVAQPAKAKSVHRPAHCGEGHLEQPSDASERASLMPQVNGLLELSGIERPPLAVAHAPSIRQCRRPTSAKAG